jgi:hypothetical protein
VNRRRFSIGLLGIALVVVGIWGAWIPHRAAALVLSGWDLAEFVKFLPGIKPVRELFFLPAWCAALALSLLANQPDHGIPRRILLGGIALALAVAIFPPYPQLLKGFQTAEFRWRFILGLAGSLLVLALWISRFWPGRWAGGLLILAALVGSVPALWQFLSIRGAVESVYAANLGWGWGLAAFIGGWGLVAVSGGGLLRRGVERSA